MGTEPDRPSPSLLRCGDRLVDLSTGEIRLPDGSVVHLPPQPTRLLALLAGEAGGVVDHETLRRHLWPDSVVDFEAGLHFCVRQVRSALGDRAEASRFVETLPRRGYRLRNVERLTAPPAAALPIRRAPADRRLGLRAARRVVLGLGVGLFGLFGVALASLREDPDPRPVAAAPAPPRLAILPFVPPAAWAEETDTEAVAELLLAAIGGQPERLEVLGPTSTGSHTPDGQALRRLAAELRVDWVVHGRYLEREGERHLLAELIRAGDGAHVWVQLFALDDDPRRIADALVGELGRRGLTVPPLAHATDAGGAGDGPG